MKFNNKIEFIFIYIFIYNIFTYINSRILEMDKQSKAKQAKQKKHGVENHTDIVNRLRKNNIDLISINFIRRELNCKWGCN